jgi:hypothetical protein
MVHRGWAREISRILFYAQVAARNDRLLPPIVYFPRSNNNPKAGASQNPFNLWHNLPAAKLRPYPTWCRASGNAPT